MFRLGWREYLTRADQVVCALLIGSGVLVMAGEIWRESARHVNPLVWSRAAPLPEGFNVELNHAPWPELALLPGIGPTLAKRIVAHRRRFRSFANVEELRLVRGIGPKKLERIRPYIRVESPSFKIAQSQSIARSSAGAE